LISVNNTKVGVKVKYASLLENDAERTVNLTISLVNRDSKSVTLPKYTYELLADGGYSFPLPTNEADNATVTLNPLQEKTYSLRAVVPASITVKNAQVLIEQQISSGQTGDTSAGVSTDVPVAVFKVNNLTANQAVKTAYVETQSGSYQVTLDSVQRLPWADSDVVAAHFVIRNYSYVKSLPVPNLTGYLVLDGIQASADDTKFILADNVSTIGPNSEVSGYLITKVPYTGDYNLVQVGLQEKLSDTSSRDVAQFAQSGIADPFPEVAANTSYAIDIKGKESNVKTRKTVVYPGTGTNIIYTELEIQNTGARLSNLPQLVGYFTSGNGDYYKATISQPQEAVQASGKGLITAWATVPRSADLSNFKLLIGEGVTDTKLSAPKEESNSYVNGTLLALPKDSTSANTTLSSLDFFPYNLSINSFQATLAGGSSLSVNMDYALTRNAEYQVDSYDHKVLLQIVDTSSGAQLEKELSFTELSEGQHSYNYSVSGSSLNDLGYGVYTLNVYDEFQGQRKLIATQSFFYQDSNN